jgi:Tfp pilus assembly protein FimV
MERLAARLSLAEGDEQLAARIKRDRPDIAERDRIQFHPRRRAAAMVGTRRTNELLNELTPLIEAPRDSVALVAGVLNRMLDLGRPEHVRVV